MSLRILLVADSRGRNLTQEISRFFNPSICKYDLIWRSGLRTEDVADFARASIEHFRPNIVYILTGICTLTKITSREPWTAGLRSPSVHGSVNLFLIAMDKAFQDIYSMSNIVGHPIMIVFPTQTGMNFTMYNNYPSDLISPHQKILNNAINEINRYIVSLNKSMLVKTPFLGSTTHPRCRHHFRSIFTKTTDGCHPTWELCQIWAYKLWRNAERNMDYYPTFSLVNHMY